MPPLLRSMLLLVAAATLAPGSSAVSLSQADEFEDGTSAGWFTGTGPNLGFPTSPQVEATGHWGREVREIENVDDPLYSAWAFGVGLRWEFFDGGRHDRGV